MAPASMGSGQWAVGSGPSVVRGPWVAPHHGDERKAMIESRGCWPDEHIQDRWPSAGLRVVVFGAGQTWVPRASGRLAGWQAGRLHAASAEAALRGATATVNKNTQCRHYPFQPPRRNAAPAPSSQLRAALFAFLITFFGRAERAPAAGLVPRPFFLEPNINQVCVVQSLPADK